MRTTLSESIKRVVRPPLFRIMHPRKPRYDCPVCGYHGPFKDKRMSRTPDFTRTDSKCPRCGAVERHRFQQLCFERLFREWDPSDKAALHIAPEFCFQPLFRRVFRAYHTADLFRNDVDFKADIQAMPFGDASYDAVFVSHVLALPDDLEQSVREIRRVLKPGGRAFLTEVLAHDKTVEYPQRRGEAIREIGADYLDLLHRHFTEVRVITASEFDQRHQLQNRHFRDGRPYDHYPEVVRLPGVGFQDFLAVCSP
ncbi:MAG: class I SAM-dependent methyltransferase [Phycisphaeraceae bacterium]|nr:class I SAM-dependent methyltransferase [Phycisphaeraceae bacterium]